MLCGYVSPLLAACVLPLLAPLQGSGRDYCRSPLPCRGARRGNPPGPPREGAGRAQSDQPHSVCPLCTLPAPSLPSGPPGGLPIMCFFSCSSLVLPLLAACALPLPPRGLKNAHVRPQRGIPISSLFSIWLIFH